MNGMVRLIMARSSFATEVALLMIRVGIGCIFVMHGLIKCSGGTSTFIWLGQQMGNVGITCMPLLWGLAAVFAELIGGACIAVGFLTRLFAGLLVFNMIVAFMYHWSKGDIFSVYAYSLLCIIIFSSLVISGGGWCSLDNFYSSRQQQ